MIYLLDTTIFSAMMRREPPVLVRCAALRVRDSVTLCTITRGETAALFAV
jgi:predicted nucleic acid-binding protein